MKKITTIIAIILFFFVFLFLIFNKKEDVKKEIDDLNFQSSAEENSKKENVLGLFDKELEIPSNNLSRNLPAQIAAQNVAGRQETNNEESSEDGEDEENDEEEDEEDPANPTPTPNSTPSPTPSPSPTPTATPNPEPTVETEKEETLEEKTDFISKSLQDETFAEKETIDATFLPDLVNLFGIEELSKVFVGVEKIEFSNFEQNGNEGKADAVVKTMEGEKQYKCYFYKISNKWYLYKTE